jgi:hypothetical protein
MGRKSTRSGHLGEKVQLIKRFVNPGTLFMVDFWRGYSQLCNNGYVHDTVNHKLHFVDPDDLLIHTQTIERLKVYVVKLMIYIYR